MGDVHGALIWSLCSNSFRPVFSGRKSFGRDASHSSLAELPSLRFLELSVLREGFNLQSLAGFVLAAAGILLIATR
jgi:hypothetical protein